MNLTRPRLTVGAAIAVMFTAFGAGGTLICALLDLLIAKAIQLLIIDVAVRRNLSTTLRHLPA